MHYDLHHTGSWAWRRVGEGDTGGQGVNKQLARFYSKWLVFQEDTSGAFAHLIGIPKALLPASAGIETGTILDCWWSALKRRVLTC